MRVRITSVKYGSSMITITCSDSKQITISLYGNSKEVRQSIEVLAAQVRRLIDLTLDVVADWRKKTLQIGDIIFKKPDDENVTEFNFTLSTMN